MRDILLAVCPYAIWGIALLEAVIAVLLLRQWQQKRRIAALLTLLVTLGLIFDAAVIGLGAFLPAGILLFCGTILFACIVVTSLYEWLFLRVHAIEEILKELES